MSSEQATASTASTVHIHTHAHTHEHTRAQPCSGERGYYLPDGAPDTLKREGIEEEERFSVVLQRAWVFWPQLATVD